MCDQLLTHFSSILSSKLNGFRKGYSCETVLMQCTEDWKKALDNNQCVGCIMMDLSRAFDSLPHGLLIAKLHAYGVDNTSCRLIKNYLSGRRQRVKVGNTYGEWQFVERGVPQGSLVGPLLFNIFVNDFLFTLENQCDVYNYADDNTLSKCHSDPLFVKTSLEDSARTAISWFSDNYMKANPGKFQAMVLSRKNVNISFNINNVTIVPTKCVKLLGIYFDDKLSFSEHVQHLCKKAGKQVNALSRLSNILSQESKKVIFNTFISSTFNYCPLVYHLCGKVNTTKMEHVVERGLKIVYNDFTSDIVMLRRQSNVPSLVTSRLRSLYIYIYKVLHNMVPCGINFEVKDVPYGLRRNINLTQSRFCTKTYGYNSISYFGAKLWNMLPNNSKTLDFNNFKEFLFKWDGLTCNG